VSAKVKLGAYLRARNSFGGNAVRYIFAESPEYPRTFYYRMFRGESWEEGISGPVTAGALNKWGYVITTAEALELIRASQSRGSNSTIV
jgi:hypothetical protein